MMSSSDVSKSSKESFSRIPQACILCRKLHLKCDGKYECSNCSKRQAKCQYGVNKKRGPKKKRSEDEAKQILPKLTVGENLSLLSIRSFYVKVYENSLAPFHPWIVPPSLDILFESSDLSPSQLAKKFLVLLILSNGARISKNYEAASQFMTESRELFHVLFSCSSSMDFASGLTLLTYYQYSFGYFEESSRLATLAYKLANELCNLHTGSDEKSESLRLLAVKSGSNYIVSLTDKDDLRYLYTKVRRVTPSYFLAYLTIAFVKSELAFPIIPNEQWDCAMVCKLLKEAEETLEECSRYYPPWFVFCLRFILTSFRAAAYWKSGKNDLAQYWAAIATDYTADGKFRYHMVGCVIGIGYITKIHALNKSLHYLQRNLESIYHFREYFPFVEDLLMQVKATIESEENFGNMDNNLTTISAIDMKKDLMMDEETD
eukprot:TRINITY_DN1060_c0_g1_i1.p1 TRINITY_DN1060_c0_g1~~TRINITY_DN1060_c0_g1_i1.p1  ORF type:complete len:432 (-),score=66.01 TRINITY_DN1060_c0_g1_i1:140-1435(-)